jgi:hypothetical protein
MFAWEDVNFNNIYDAGDVILIGPNVPFTSHIGKIALQESHTKNIGLAWCAGTQSLNGYTINCDGSTMGNIAQTDSFTAFMNAYAEQQRNNGDFSCNPILP